MRIVVASNPFKGSMSGIEAADRIEAGLKAGLGRVVVDKAPVADGGDGTLDAVAAGVKSERVYKKVSDPLGRRVKADYLLIDGGRAAVVEMARASGLVLLKSNERNPEGTTSRGTGELIRDALGRGVKRVIVGIGGSATNDGGAGIAAALGWRFLAADGKPVEPRGGELARVVRIDSRGVHPRLKDVEIIVASDVTNPLLGPNGAAAVYSPQKGATPQQVKRLEAGMKSFADVVEAALGRRLRDAPGAGAAGGTGYGLMAFLGAKLVSGISMMIEIARLEERVKKSDLVITGEGHIDSQTAQGKAPFGVLKLAKKHGVPVIAFCGGVEDEESLRKAGFTAVIPIADGPMTLEEAVAGGGALLERAVRRTAWLIRDLT
jgi:glycerate kinase